jgi:hypothetical protein
MSMVESGVPIVVPNSEVSSEVSFAEISQDASLVPIEASSVRLARWPAVALLFGGVLSAVWSGLLCTGFYWVATELPARLW